LFYPSPAVHPGTTLYIQQGTPPTDAYTACWEIYQHACRLLASTPTAGWQIGAIGGSTCALSLSPSCTCILEELPCASQSPAAGSSRTAPTARCLSTGTVSCLQEGHVHDGNREGEKAAAGAHMKAVRRVGICSFSAHLCSGCFHRMYGQHQLRRGAGRCRHGCGQWSLTESPSCTSSRKIELELLVDVVMKRSTCRKGCSLLICTRARKKAGVVGT
jgi:hypothetical protein